MPAHNRLSSVCHSTAHHAVSGLSYIHPHLRQACRLAGKNSVTIQLIDSNPYPACLPHLQPLFLGLGALKTKFVEILGSEGFSVTDLESVTLRFEFEPRFKDDYSSNCFVKITARNGKSYEHFVDHMGFKIKPETSCKL